MAEAAARQQQPKTADLVLSCSICQDTLSAIYAIPESRDGLQQSPHDGSGLTSSGSTTKLWLTECAHITCGKHLEGGGVPFHPENELPRAPCPFCSMYNRDQSTKILYAIRGISKGQYDDSIPNEYLQVPPPQLGQPGNEALRFQYVSLLRFASKMHERLSTSDRELNTWKDREQSIVACLAATEPLGRALHIARDQLLDLGGDVSIIDDALHLASSLRENTGVASGKESISNTNDSHTVLEDQNLAASSSLARGSAADLQILRDNVLQPDDHELPHAAQVGGFEDSRPLKRKRLDTTTDLRMQHQHSPDEDRILQQPSSRDAMPPPTQLMHDTTWMNLNKPATSRQYQTINQTPSRNSHTSPIPQDHSCTLSHVQRPTFSRASIISGDRSYGVSENMLPATSNLLRQCQFDDGELDQKFRFSAPSRVESRPLGVSPNRLTLPPSTPSLFNYTIPRRIGISANARTSKSSLPTPKNSRSPQRRVSSRPPTQSNAPAASPYFSSRSLASGPVAPGPYINRPPQQMAQPTARSHSTVNPPMYAPTASAPWKLSWLTAPFRQGQHESQSQQGLRTERLQNGSGAYRQPAGYQHRNDQRPSLNSFSFMNQPQIENVDVGKSSQAAYASHGRRPARR